MIQYPLSFYAQAKTSSGIHSHWSIESQSITSPCSIPEEFEGPGGALSPEDLFAQALTNCFIATFKVCVSFYHLRQNELIVKKHF